MTPGADKNGSLKESGTVKGFAFIPCVMVFSSILNITCFIIIISVNRISVVWFCL